MSSLNNSVEVLVREPGVGVEAMNGSWDEDAMEVDVLERTKELLAPNVGKVGRSSSAGGETPNSLYR